MRESEPNGIRSFAAIELRDEDRDVLRRLIDELRSAGPEIRWVAPEILHLTLIFFGDVPPREVDAIRDALAGICERHAPFSMTLRGAGAFPNARRPRTIWAGISGDVEPLRALSNDVGRAMKALGYPPDKAFRPHITLGRSRTGNPAPALTRSLEDRSDVALSECPVEAVTLFKSDLRPRGPVYTPLARLPLGR